MLITKNECPQCQNNEAEKIILHKVGDVVDIYKCEVCDFRWGIAKEGK